MSKQTNNFQMVQVYDKVKELVYTKIVPGLFWSHEETVKTQQIENERVLDIRFTGKIDTILLNGKKLKI